MLDITVAWVEYFILMFCNIRDAISKCLGTHISIVKSISLDDWNYDLLKTFKSLGGNAAIMRKYGKNKTAHSSPEHQISDFIRAKYVQQKSAKKRKQKKKSQKQKRKRPQHREQNKKSIKNEPDLWEPFEDSHDSNKENALSNEMVPDLIGAEELKNFNFLPDLAVIEDDTEQPFDAFVVKENKLSKRAILSKYNDNRPSSWIQFESTPRIASNGNSLWNFDQQKSIDSSRVDVAKNNKVAVDVGQKQNCIPRQIVSVPEPEISSKKKVELRKKQPAKKMKLKKHKSAKALTEKKAAKSFNPWSYIDDLCNYGGSGYDGNISY